MRLDKFLKVSKIIKRRTVANEIVDAGRVIVNGKPVKPSYEVKIGDIVIIKFGDKFKILLLKQLYLQHMIILKKLLTIEFFQCLNYMDLI